MIKKIAILALAVQLYGCAGSIESAVNRSSNTGNQALLYENHVMASKIATDIVNSLNSGPKVVTPWVTMDSASSNGPELSLSMLLTGELSESTRSSFDSDPKFRRDFLGGIVHTIRGESCADEGIRGFLDIGGSVKYSFSFAADRRHVGTVLVSHCPT